jgi:outer membrane protein insertion porin family
MIQICSCIITCIFQCRGQPILTVQNGFGASAGCASFAVRDRSGARPGGGPACCHGGHIAAILLLAFVLLATIRSAGQQEVVSNIDIHGNRRIPAETIRARMMTRPGDVYDPAALERDFNSLWNTGYFEDLRFEREDTAKGVLLHVYVKERPTIREINYDGLHAVSQSDVLDRFKERKVGLTKESQYDPTKIKRAEVILKELLAEHGRQFASVRAEVRPIPPSAVGVTFIVKEGPKVKVGRISFQGNRRLGSRYLRSSMKNLRPIGIPHSIFLENLISKTFDATKLSEDTERVRDAYQRKGYFKALVEDPKTQIRDSGSGLRVPFWGRGGGKSMDITVPVEEGERFRLSGITFTGNKAITNTTILRKQFAMKDGDVFNTDLVRKGLENLRKAYGQLGYIKFAPVPNTKIDDEKRTVALSIDLDEGKPYSVRRIEFQGNTTTRDKVIRRELAIEEGQVYNTQLWDLSLLRLNQLNYFESLKPEEATERTLNDQDGTVDLTLKVKEKGKNSISLTGGVSGLAGTFIGFGYSTNNLFGLGETLSFNANIGNLSRDISLSFVEPYAFDRPLQLGGSVYHSRYDYNQAKQTSALLNQTLNLPQNVLNTLQNFRQSSTGFTLSAAYPLRRSFKRIGISYGYDRSSIQTFSDASQQYFNFLAFRNISGPNALTGIVTSKITPNFSVNTIDSPSRPHQGHSFYVATEFAGIGGNVKDVRPIVEYKQFIPMKGLRPLSRGRANEGRQTLGFRVQGSFLTGYGGLAAPPFSRFFLGGDNDIRGFDVRSITPYAFITNKVNVPLSPQTPINPNDLSLGFVNVNLPVQQIVFTGGDTSLVGNFEYRIPIAGPVTLAIFNDIGFNGVARASQLALSATQLNTLSSTQFFCPTLSPGGLGGCATSTLPPGTLTSQLHVIPGTNWQPRMSTGIEFQIIMPVINAPFRIYWAYNPLRLNTFTQTLTPQGTPGNLFSRSSFPLVGPGAGAGQQTYLQALQSFAPAYQLKEPVKTFRFTVSTTF